MPIAFAGHPQLTLFRVVPQDSSLRRLELLVEFPVTDVRMGAGLGANSRGKVVMYRRSAPAVVLLDVARHVYDAAEHLADPDPLAQPGVVLLAGADAWCAGPRLNQFLELLDARFPKLQFLVTLSASGRRQFPTGFLRKRLPVPEAQPRPRPCRVRRLAPATVLLVDVDSTLPNLALMKLSRSFKARGRRVVLARGVQSLPMAGTILASCVFNTSGSAKRVQILRRRCGDTLVLGGSGVDLDLRLAVEVEGLAAGYSLYPELGDRAIGFLTRGCPQHCPFCIWTRCCRAGRS